MRVVPVPWPLPPAATLHSHRTIGDNLFVADQQLARIAADAADVICLPEGFLTADVRYGHAREIATHGSAVLRQAAQWARRLRANLCVPLLIEESGRCFNTVVVLGADGEARGRYDKMHPWPSTPDMTELEKGVTPGVGAWPIALDAGLVGLQTCFDVNWPDGWRQLVARGARLILFPSEYAGGFALQARAREAGVAVVSAVLRGPSRVVEPTGEIAAEILPADFPRVVALNLNRVIVHLDHQSSALRALSDDGAGVTWRQLENDTVALVEAPPDGPSVADLLARAGVSPLSAYLTAAADAIGVMRP